MLNKFFRRNILGSLVLAPRAPCVQVAISATVPGVLPAFAGFAWVILSLTGAMDAISGQGGYLLSARLLRGDCVHAVAGDPRAPSRKRWAPQPLRPRLLRLLRLHC